MNFPLSPRRTYLIARRDFIEYIKTWGFWLTALAPFIGLFFGLLIPLVMANSQPTKYAVILDETGRHASQIEQFLDKESQKFLELALSEAAKYTIPNDQKDAFDLVLENQGPDEARELIRTSSPRIAELIDLPESKLKFITAPADTIEALKPYVLDEKQIIVDGEAQSLSGVLHIYERDGKEVAEFWTIAASKSELVGLAERYFSSTAADNYLEAGGLNQDDYRAVRKDALNVDVLNPEKPTDGDGGQAVTNKDRIPYLVAAVLVAILWMAVFTGAYMLLVSMVEEKINKVLEMLLASTRFSEIFIGKLLGVGALTLASLLPWIIVGGVGLYAALQFGDGALADGLAQAMSLQMLVFLPVFFVLGYVFYGSIFIALGAMAESMQDASTLMTPIVLVLTACVLVVPVGIADPDSPLLAIAAWIPFSSPFAAIIRLPSDPPLWETLGSVLVLIFSTAFMIWISSRMVRHGVLVGGGVGAVKSWFLRVVLRKKPALK